MTNNKTLESSRAVLLKRQEIEKKIKTNFELLKSTVLTDF